VPAERSEEIAAWLRNFKTCPIESFVIIDDNGNMGLLQSRLVQTKEEEGLTEDDADRAIQMLSPAAEIPNSVRPKKKPGKHHK
jgi:hypothetical protein